MIAFTDAEGASNDPREWTLPQFFERYYVPTRLSDGAEATLEAYRDSLSNWSRILGFVALKDIDALTMQAFVKGLKEGTRRTAEPSPNTIRKHLRHIQAVLDRAGPGGPRRRDAAGYLKDVPWIKPPRERRSTPKRAVEEDIAALYAVCDLATMPRVEGIPPGSWWRALISVICCTSIRVGQATACPADAIDWKNRTLTLPPECSRKSLREECHPLHPVAIRDLLVIRGEREKLFPMPHAKTALYKQLYRLQTKADIPEERQFAFHCLRRTAITLIAKQSSAAAQMAAGHASFKTTVNHYLCQDVLSEAVDQLDFLDQLERPS